MEKLAGVVFVPIANCQCPDTDDLHAYLTQQEDILVVGQAQYLRELLSSIRRARPLVVLLDVPTLDIGGGVASKVLRDSPGTRVLIRCRCEHCEADQIASVLQRGVWGCLSKADPHVRCLEAIRAVKAGQIWATRDTLSRLVRSFVDTESAQRRLPKLPSTLTGREREIVDSLAGGMTNKEIGKQLGISDKTVKTHLKNIFGKLGVHRRVNLLRELADLR